VIAGWLEGLAETARLLRLSALLLVGRRYLLACLLPLCWPAFQALLLIGGGGEAFAPSSAQGTLLGLPLAVLAIFLGVRVIAGEIDGRRLEIAYTVPGGAQRVWLGKLGAAVVLLLVAEALLAAVAFAFFTEFPPGALYGAFQAAFVYLVLAMGLATLLKSEVAGALVSAAALMLNGIVTGFGGNQSRLSPFFNADLLAERDLALAFTVQNRIGFALLAAGLVGLAIAHAERRERMLGG
jgi:hypothetical protein